MSRGQTSSVDLIRRRCRLLALLQEHSPAGLSRQALAPLLDCDPRTVARDLHWLQAHGVPIQRTDGRGRQVRRCVAPDFNAARWLWIWATSEETQGRR